MQTSVTAL